MAQGTELETMRQYQELLQALEHHCDQILASEEVTEGAIAQAQQAKDKLYLTFSKVSLPFILPPRDSHDAMLWSYLGVCPIHSCMVHDCVCKPTTLTDPCPSYLLN